MEEERIVARGANTHAGALVFPGRRRFSFQDTRRRRIVLVVLYVALSTAHAHSAALTQRADNGTTFNISTN
jgi:hypothetical protein